MKKEYRAQPLEEHIEELRGMPSEKVDKLVSIHYIYSKPASENNIKKHLIDPEGKVDPLVELDENGNATPFGTMFYWHTPVHAHPRTIGQIVSIATALNIDLFWEESTWKEYLFINRKY